MDQFERDSIAFFSRLGRVSKRYLDSVLDEQPKCHFGILHRVVMAIESCGQDGCIPVSKLTKLLKDMPQAVSRDLRVLEQDGLVERYPDPADRRKTMVRLTQEGKRCHDACEKALRQHGLAVVERMGQERLHRMFEDFNSLLEALEAEAANAEVSNNERSSHD